MGSIDGYQRPAAAADFERCVQLLGTHPHDNELLAALTAIIRHHIVRSGMHALTQVVEMLRGSDEQRAWMRYIIESLSARLAYARGDREAALHGRRQHFCDLGPGPPGARRRRPPQGLDRAAGVVG